MRAGIEHGAVFGVGDHARLHRDAHDIADGDRNVGAILPRFFHFGRAAYQLEAEEDIRGKRSGAEGVQADVTHPAGVQDVELEITAAVATAGLLQGVAADADADIDEIGPDNVFRDRAAAGTAGA